MPSEINRRIRQRAYELWVEGGRVDGHSDRDWRQAEKEVSAQTEMTDGKTGIGKAAKNGADAKVGGKPKAAADGKTKSAKPKDERSKPVKSKDGSTKAAASEKAGKSSKKAPGRKDAAKGSAKGQATLN